MTCTPLPGLFRVPPKWEAKCFRVLPVDCGDRNLPALHDGQGKISPPQCGSGEARLPAVWVLPDVILALSAK